eukprot:TRINITY_DN31136_c0_g6_i1.p1 TRINITY_DN31136_c0_g6~~TRINITY_DN31136_c0_g6_i1.p1  ORF type:complete len:165 (-),score=45.41 TRINITY_DN31136_c0_g6_i1:173-667(-)
MAPPPGKVRCKRFGCNQYYDPNNPAETVCVFHQSPPVFHETAKWWSCCADKKCFEFEEFMKVPGCMRGEHSQEDPKQKFKGGQDLRDEAAGPQRIEEAVPQDPRKRLDLLRKGLNEIGLDEGEFDRAWGRMAAKHGDLHVVSSKLGELFTEALENWEEDVNMPD